MSALLANASRADHSGERVQRAIRLLRHVIFLSQNVPPKPPAGFFLPRPPCLPQSDNCALCFAAVANPPPDAIHRGHTNFAPKCFGQAGISDLTAKVSWSETSRRKSVCAPEKLFLLELSTMNTPTLSPHAMSGTAQYDRIPSPTLCSST